MRQRPSPVLPETFYPLQHVERTMYGYQNTVPVWWSGRIPYSGLPHICQILGPSVVVPGYDRSAPVARVGDHVRVL